MILIRVLCTIALVGYLLLFVLVFRDVRRSNVRFFILFLLAMLVWQVGITFVSFTSNPEVGLHGYRIVIGMGATFGLFYTQFTRDFLGVRSQPRIVWVGYVLFGVIALWALSGRPGFITDVSPDPSTGMLLPIWGPGAYLGAIVLYGYLAYSAFLLYSYHRRWPSFQMRVRIKYLLIGLLFVFIGSMANLSDTLKPYPFDMVANVINATLIAYAILRYQLLDISVVVRKGLIYSTLTATIGIAYFFGVFLALNLFHVVTGYQIFLLSLFLAALTAVALQPLRDALQAWLDKLFFREKYDAGLMLMRLSHTAASVLQLDKLTAMILDDVLTTMHISHGAFFIKDEKGGEYRLRAYKGSDPAPDSTLSMRSDSPVISWLSSHQSSLSSPLLETDPAFIGLWTREREDLKRINAELFVPLLAAGKLSGVLALGPKLSETPFAAEEELTFDTLANQTAVAIENARLFSETLAEKERTATIVEQAFAGIILLDSQIRVAGLNPAAEAIIGCDHQQAIGAPLSDILGRNILAERSSLRKAMVTGERVAPREETLVAGSRRRDVLLGVTPLPGGFLLSLADITQLKEVDRLKSDIVANVSHEFRTPLAIIKAYSELLMDDQQGGMAASRHEYLAIIDAETDRLAGMVSGLLDLARLEAGQGIITMGPVCLEEVVTEVVKLLQTQAHAHDLTVTLHVARDLPAIRANRELLITLVRNLLGNAIKFSREGGRVDVVARQEGNSMILQVTDQGIGMSEDDIGHLFEKFYRGSTAKDAGIRGTGLGLVLTKQAVEAHGGTISVESQLGSGTSFTVLLPVGNGAGPAQHGVDPEGEGRLADPMMWATAGALAGA